MYRSEDKTISFLGFNQPLGLQLNPNNRWIQLAERVPWDKLETEYSNLFPSSTGNIAKPLRMALGSLIIQNKFQFSDRELVDQLTENPYFQYFIGLPGYQSEAPFDASTLVLFRKRLSADVLKVANEYLIDQNKDNDHSNPPSSGGNVSGTNKSAVSENAECPNDEQPVADGNKGTLIIDATCAPVNIRYPQDVSLLNEAREKLECMLYRMCRAYGIKLPRRYKRRARKDFLAYAKARKHSKKQIRTALRKQLAYVHRDIGYLEKFFSQGYVPDKKDIPIFLTIIKLYEQQEYMYKNKVHTVENRIVSISQPWIRPIVRGKAKAPVEFGPKLDLSIDENGYGRLEKISFDAYNESKYLIGAINRYWERTGHYPERVLADQIYRTRENRSYCKKHGIRLSGPKLGRPTQESKEEKKQAYQDNTDRIEVERDFSRDKRCFGMGRIVTKLKETQLTSIALSVFVSNLFRIPARILVALFYLWQKFVGIFEIDKVQVA